MTEWEKIVADHGGTVWKTAWRLLGNRADAADCFQETFIAALEFSRAQPVHNWGGLLQRLATCKAMDQLRQRFRRLRLATPLEDCHHVASGNSGPEADAMAAELSDGLRRAIAALPEDQAAVFSLGVFSEMKYREIARQLGLKTSAVGVLLYRARVSLRQSLLSHMDTEEVEVSA